jgi:hypothetical protein
MSPITKTFTGAGVEPQVSSAAQAGTRTLRVTFSEDMNPNAALSTVSNYTIGGPTTIAVTAVTPENLVDPVYVDLTLDALPALGTNNYSVTVSATLQDLVGNPMDPAYLSAAFSGWTRDSTSTCFEDNLPAASTLDALLQTTIAGRPNAEKVRQLFITRGTLVGSQQAAARTLLWLAAETDLRAIFGALADVNLEDVAGIRLCYRVRMLDMDTLLQRFSNVIRGAANEVKLITGEQVFQPIQEYLDSSSPVYRVSAAATLVLIAACATPLES